MKAISLTQPWATLVAIGAKHHETRSWATGYRGLLVIHATAGFPEWARSFARDSLCRRLLAAAGYPHVDQLPRGAIVAVARLTACLPTHTRSGTILDLVSLSEQERELGDFTPGRWAWQLEDVLTLPAPLRCPGSQGLWEPPADAQAVITALLAYRAAGEAAAETGPAAGAGSG